MVLFPEMLRTLWLQDLSLTLFAVAKIHQNILLPSQE
jgi:hypothetical protein